MGTKSKCEIHLHLIYSLWIYRFYLGYKIQLSIEFNSNLKLKTDFIYKYLHLYSTVFMSASKTFWILEVFRFQNFG
jgi:hypothetical protein